VGDSLTSDVAGANRSGIDACWFNPAGLPLPPAMEIRYQIRELGELVGIVAGRRDGHAAPDEEGRARPWREEGGDDGTREESL